MAIAAAPAYLQATDPEFYLSAPPGHRFLMYLPVWSENQEKGTLDWTTADRVPKIKIDKKTGLEIAGKFGAEWDTLPNDSFAFKVAACSQPVHDPERPRKRKPKADKGLEPWRPMIDALQSRQNLAFNGFHSAQCLRLQATAVAPFTTGLGNEHPLENGFAFLNPYGLPYLPGSGVKGVLRAAAQELASGEWGASDWEHSKDHLKRHEVHEREDKDGKKGKHLFNASDIDVLFGSEALAGENHLRGVLSFWDVIPQIEGNSLMVEIMTPHQSHYYQQDAKKGAGSTSPHDSGSPNPISFLTVPPHSKFAFHVVCDSARLQHLAPDLATNARWKVLLTEAFKHAFEWLGFGAKASVGYGAMESEAMRLERVEEVKQRENEERELRRQKDTERQAQNAQAWSGAKIKFNRANKSLSVEKDGKTAVAVQPKGEELLNTLPADTRTRIMGNQFVKVTAFVAEGVLVKVQPSL